MDDVKKPEEKKLPYKAGPKAAALVKAGLMEPGHGQPAPEPVKKPQAP